MKYNYNLELNNIVEKIYKELIYKIAINDSRIDFSKDKIDNTKKLLSSEKVYIGSDMDEFIINYIPKGHEGNLFRVCIAKYHNRLHPRFENYKGEPIIDSSYNKFALLLWEEHMNNLLISDVQNLFNQKNFINFVDDKLDNYIDELSSRITEYKNKLVTIDFKNKENLLETIANMILNEELPFELSHSIVDMDKLRDDMTKMATSFDMYNEFDKLEDDTKYCLINYCKYNPDDLLNELTSNHGFKLVSNGCLIKNK